MRYVRSAMVCGAARISTHTTSLLDFTGHWCRIDFEPGHIIGDDEPHVLIFGPNRLRWVRKAGICKRTKCDAREFRRTTWLPIDVRSTANAEVKLDGEAARRSTFEAISSPALTLSMSRC
jgi:hypothetical protein